MRMFDIVLTVIIELARIFITLEYFRIFLDCESRFKEMLAGLLAFLLTSSQKDAGFVDGEFSHIHFGAPPIHI